MKKILCILLMTVTLSACFRSHTEEGAYIGGNVGSIVGNAIGIITGGERGGAIGQLIGMAGGTMVGAIIGNEADKKEMREWERRQDRRIRHRMRDHQRRDPDYQDYYGTNAIPRQNDTYQPTDSINSGFDPSHGGDDRIEDWRGRQPQDNISGSRISKDTLPQNTYGYPIEIRDPMFIDPDNDRMITPDEVCQVVFEIYNHNKQALRQISPMVVCSDKNKYIHISPTVVISEILPDNGIKYTAMVMGDKRLRKGYTHIEVYVQDQNGKVISRNVHFNIKCGKRHHR